MDFKDKQELASAERRNFLKLAGTGSFTAAMVAGAGGMLWSEQAAAQTADVVFITDDNPRSEDPASIRAMVRAGATGPADATRFLTSLRRRTGCD